MNRILSLFFFFFSIPLVAQKAELTEFLNELRNVEKTHIVLDDALIEKTFEKVGPELVEAVLSEMKNSPHVWVIKESLNVAKVIGNHPKNLTPVLPIILFGLEDSNAEIRNKALLSMRLLKDHFTSKDLEKASQTLANILYYDFDLSARNTCAKTIQTLEMKNLVHVLILALKVENSNVDKGALVSALKKITDVSTIYGVDIKAWDSWYNQNGSKFGKQVAPNTPPEMNIQEYTDPKKMIDTSNPQSVLLSFAKCLKDKSYPTIYKELISHRDEKKGRELTADEKKNQLDGNCRGLYYYRRYYDRFFQRFERDYKDPESVTETINSEEAFVEYTMEQFLPEDRFSYVKVALEFELVRIFVDHNVAVDDKPPIQTQKKEEANKKILQWHKEAKAITKRQDLSPFFKDWYAKQYPNKKEMPPIQQFYVLSEFEKKNRHHIQDLISEEFSSVFTTARGYEFYYCINSKWQVQIIR